MLWGRVLLAEASYFCSSAGKLTGRYRNVLGMPERNFFWILNESSESGGEMDGFLANRNESEGQIQGISGFFDAVARVIRRGFRYQLLPLCQRGLSDCAGDALYVSGASMV